MHTELTDALRQRGWFIDDAAACSVPELVAERYEWVPPQVLETLSSTGVVLAPDKKSWLLTGAVFDGTVEAAFRWDEWERLSLESAIGDEEWAKSIVEFWDQHFPIAMSVRTGYGYLALRKSDLRVVVGEEPEFEETEEFSSSFFQLQLALESLEAGTLEWFEGL